MKNTETGRQGHDHRACVCGFIDRIRRRSKAALKSRHLFLKIDSSTATITMEADDDKSMGMDEAEAPTANGGRMSITEEDVANVDGGDASDGLSCGEDDEDDEELSDDDEDEGDYDIYYGGDNEDLDDGRGGVNDGSGSQFNNNDDPEYFAYDCLSVVQVKDMLAEVVSSVCASIQVSNDNNMPQKRFIYQ